MFDRFTKASVKSIMLAQEESRRLGHNFVSSEQILLGLIREGAGIAAQSLKFSGTTLEGARVEVEKIIGRGTAPLKVEMPFLDDAKRVLELSWEEAKRLGHDYISTEHLLLGILRKQDCVAVKILQELGVNLGELETRIIQLIGDKK